ncbi:hypothetical protein FHG87_017671 [Trinorchestia longiramus]|nr:hypothetical protein FHG87_017671 [Trinorchestia longiramus]
MTEGWPIPPPAPCFDLFVMYRVDIPRLYVRDGCTSDLLNRSPFSVYVVDAASTSAPHAWSSITTNTSTLTFLSGDVPRAGSFDDVSPSRAQMHKYAFALFSSCAPNVMFLA